MENQPCTKCIVTWLFSFQICIKIMEEKDITVMDVVSCMKEQRIEQK